MKVLLANDTGMVPHVGCKAVSDAHARLLGRAGHQIVHRRFLERQPDTDTHADADVVRSLERDEHLASCIDDVDAVIVNGEGTIHHDAGRRLLALLAIAQRQRKTTLLVNAVFQGTSGFDDTLRRLDDFTVREPRSLHHALERGLSARIVPDSYFAARFEDGGSAFSGDVVTDWHWQRSDVGAALTRYMNEEGGTFLPFVTPTADTTWANVPKTLSTARVVLTGRHHGVCAAIVAGRPFVALPSNTFKIQGMLEGLGLGRLLAADFDQLLAARDWALENEGLFASLAGRLAGERPLTTFRQLGTAGESREETEVAALAADIQRADASR